jgi:hypothetical protein
MDAGAHHDASLRDDPQRDRHQRADGREDDRRVELLRRLLVRAAGPGGAEIAREPLALLVAGAGERKDLAALVGRDLRDYVGGGAEAVEAQAFGVAAHAEGAVADQARAEQRRGLEVRVTFGDRETEAPFGHRALRVSAVYLVAGEAGVVAEVLPVRAAVAAGAVGVAEPGNADPITAREPVPALFHRADYLVAGDQGQLRIRELAVHDVKVRPAHRAGVDPDQDPVRAWFRFGDLGGTQRLARRVEDHRAHSFAPNRPRVPRGRGGSRHG